MFKLYDMYKIELLLSNPSEKIIIDKIGQIVTDNCYLMVKSRVNGGDVVKGIRNHHDYCEYKKDFENRELLSKSCVELKREIINIAEKPKVRSLNENVAKSKLK